MFRNRKSMVDDRKSEDDNWLDKYINEKTQLIVMHDQNSIGKDESDAQNIKEH